MSAKLTPRFSLGRLEGLFKDSAVREVSLAVGVVLGSGPFTEGFFDRFTAGGQVFVLPPVFPQKMPRSKGGGMGTDGRVYLGGKFIHLLL